MAPIKSTSAATPTAIPIFAPAVKPFDGAADVVGGARWDVLLAGGSVDVVADWVAVPVVDGEAVKAAKLKLYPSTGTAINVPAAVYVVVAVVKLLPSVAGSAYSKLIPEVIVDVQTPSMPPLAETPLAKSKLLYSKISFLW
jgi:hypothetical protein